MTERIVALPKCTMCNDAGQIIMGQQGLQPCPQCSCPYCKKSASALLEARIAGLTGVELSALASIARAYSYPEDWDERDKQLRAKLGALLGGGER